MLMISSSENQAVAATDFSWSWMMMMILMLIVLHRENNLRFAQARHHHRIAEVIKNRKLE